MNRPATLTHRDIELVQALTQKVRLFNLRQVSRQWWYGDLANARRRLRSLAAAGLLNPLVAQARSIPSLEAPVIQWQPDDNEPRFGEISHRLKTRWRSRPVRSVRVYVATEKAAHLFGGVGHSRLKAPTQATHDLGVAAVWLHLANNNAPLAAAWRGEDLMADTRRDEKLPDAFILNAGGDVTSVTEFGGAYSAERVRAFHEDCAGRVLPYELW